MGGSPSLPVQLLAVSCTGKGFLSLTGLFGEEPSGLWTTISRDRKSCHRSRHVDRRYFKVRELSFEGLVRVEHIDTSTNRADLLTKPLKREVFAKHRSGLMNLTDVSAAPPAEVVAVVAPPTSLLLVNPNQRSSTLQRMAG